MRNEMPQLPYPKNGLEPVISAETLEFHFGKHMQTYVTNLANLTKDTAYAQKDIEEIVKTAPAGGIFNNAGQVLNHALYFLQFTTPGQSKGPEGRLAELIARDFGNLDELKRQMEEAAIGLFGSGWAWLVSDKDGNLSIETTSNAKNPLAEGKKAIMTVDVWEHAYYIDYRNVRGDGVKAALAKTDWQIMEERYAK